MKLFGIAGWSGSGKTTLMLRLIPALARRGITVGTIKHSHHDLVFGDAETQGLARAGAVETVTASPSRVCILHEQGARPESTLEELASRLAAVDLILVEGFKFSPHPKLEVWDPALGKPLLALEDGSVVALACDGPLPPTGRPVFGRGAVDDIADFIRRHCGLETG